MMMMMMMMMMQFLADGQWRALVHDPVFVGKEPEEAPAPSGHEEAVC